MKRETFAEVQEDWSQITGGCNWYTFRFCLIEFEWDRSLGGVEFTIVILGLGIRVRHNYAETEHTRNLARMIENIKDTNGEKDAS